jgi:IS30 family transposase
LKITETIYTVIDALSVGHLRKELIYCLRQGKTTRKPRRGEVDRRGQIPDMVSIHLGPPEVVSVNARPLGGRSDQGQE